MELPKYRLANIVLTLLLPETQALPPMFYVYDLRMTLGSTVFTPLYGYLNIQETVFE